MTAINGQIVTDSTDLPFIACGTVMLETQEDVLEVNFKELNISHEQHIRNKNTTEVVKMFKAEGYNLSTHLDIYLKEQTWVIHDKGPDQCIYLAVPILPKDQLRIGRARTRRTFGSGAIVGNRHILTASHNFREVTNSLFKKYRYWPALNIEIDTLDDEKEYLAAVPPELKPIEIDTENVHPLNSSWETEFNNAPWATACGDLCVAILKETLPSKIINKVKPKFRAADFDRLEIKKGMNVHVAGYARRFRGKLWYSTGVVHGTGIGFFMYEAKDLEDGNSGSPIWVEKGGIATVIGIHSGTKRSNSTGFVPTNARARELLRLSENYELAATMAPDDFKKFKELGVWTS